MVSAAPRSRLRASLHVVACLLPALLLLLGLARPAAAEGSFDGTVVTADQTLSFAGAMS